MSRRSKAVAIAVAAVAAAGITAVLLWPETPHQNIAHPPPLADVGAAEPIADGSDPTRAGCASDAVTMATTNVHFPVQDLSGEIDLRYSPRCHAAWGRFAPVVGWNPGPGTMVTVWTLRPADQATQSFSVEFGGENVVGNILMTARGCIVAEVSMTRGPLASPLATTTCVTIS